MRCFAISSIVVYYINLILNILNKKANWMKFKIVKA